MYDLLLIVYVLGLIILTEYLKYLWYSLGLYYFKKYYLIVILKLVEMFALSYIYYVIVKQIMYILRR